jgi:hypothetical protein
MTRKPAKSKRSPDDPAQYKRFLEAAKKAEASDDPRALDRALKKLAPSAKPSARRDQT